MTSYIGEFPTVNEPQTTSNSSSLLGGLTGGLADLLDGLGDSVETLLDPAGGTVDDVVDSIADLLRSSGSEDGGLLGNLFSAGMPSTGGGLIQGIGLLDGDGLLSLDLLGTQIAVLPDNGGIVTLDASGTPSGGGDILDLGGIVGPGGLLNLTDLIGPDGLIELDGVLEAVVDLLGADGIDPDDFTDEDGKIDPSKFEKVFMGTNGKDQISVTLDVSTYVDGKAGIDTVVFGRSSADLSVTVGSNAVMFTDKDSLFYFNDVERVKFFDGALYLDTGAGENAGVGYRLYQAAFDRAPDNDGVKYWVQRIDDGLSWKDAASGFVNSAEFKQTYGTLTNQQFVSEIYQNVLGREGEAEGTAFWVDFLNTNKGDRANVLLGFSESGENVALVGASIDNGYTVS